MKKLLITAICATAAISGFAQGTVDFRNAFGTAIKIVVPGTSSNNATSGTIASMTGQVTGPGASTGVVDVGLVWGTSAGSVTTLAGIETITATAAGQLQGNGVFAVSGTAQNDVDFFQVFAWDSSFGNSLAGMNAAIAAGAYFGASTGTQGVYGSIGAPLSVTLGNPAGPGTQIFGTLAGQFHTFQLLTPTPEPATLALGGLGAAALLLFRRRK